MKLYKTIKDTCVALIATVLLFKGFWLFLTNSEQLGLIYLIISISLITRLEIDDIKSKLGEA